MTTGQRIKMARKTKGMTQAELAEKLSVPFQSISQWERDVRNPKIETLKKIADALGVPLADLSGWNDAQEILSGSGLSVEDLAEEMAIPPHILQQILSDETTPLSALQKIVSVATLLSTEENRKKQLEHITINHVKEAFGHSEHVQQMSLSELYRAGFLKFNSDEDRTAFFYSHLNDAGKIAAGGYFFRHVKPENMKDVADYVLGLYENPLYKAQDAPAAPSEGTDTPAPPEGAEKPTEDK